MKLGAFSVSLNVKDINKSYEFYQKLGFTKFHGEIEQNWLILKNGETVIGLFQGMLDKNMLTFNPGWNQNGENLDDYDDIRKIRDDLQAKGVEIVNMTEENPEGPANFFVEDPDGNVILLDQHI